MKKKMIIGVVLLLAIVGTIVFFTSNKQSTPEKAIGRLENAINKNDIRGVINCLTPQLQEEAEELINRTEGAVDAPVKMLINVMPLLSGVLDIKVMPEVKIDILEEEIQEEQARYKVKLTLVEKNISLNAEVKMLRIKKQWYIETVKPNLF